MEATGGFEPPNRGFADPRLRPLGYVAEGLVRYRGEDSSGISAANAHQYRLDPSHTAATPVIYQTVSIGANPPASAIGRAFRLSRRSVG